MRKYRTSVAFRWGDYSDVVKTTTFTTNVDEYQRVRDERYKYFKTDLPTSTLIGVTRLADPFLMVEIECTAVIQSLNQPAEIIFQHCKIKIEQRHE
jgi:enamine deaminase RidA (YjgF/YER057c/UK114 family)